MRSTSSSAQDCSSDSIVHGADGVPQRSDGEVLAGAGQLVRQRPGLGATYA